MSLQNQVLISNPGEVRDYFLKSSSECERRISKNVAKVDVDRFAHKYNFSLRVFPTS